METLKDIPVFSGLDDDALQNIRSRGSVKTFAKDEFIVRYGEQGRAMYVILEGCVKLTLFGEDGKAIVLTSLGRGAFFGELSLLDDKARSCTISATTDCKMFIITRALFLDMLHEHPSVMFSILKEMAVRLRKADSKIGSLALLDVYDRTVEVLYGIANDDGAATEGGYLIDRLPTHEELANLVGTTRESVSRVMAHIRSLGVLKHYKGRAAVLRKR